MEDQLSEVAREFVRLAFAETGSKRELAGTEAVAQEASDEYDGEQARAKRASTAMGEHVEPQHISGITQEGALNKLAREVSRERSFNDNDAEEMDGEALLDMLAQAVADRRAGK